MKRPSQVQVYLRYFRSLLWEFRWPLGVFWGLVLVGGFVICRCEGMNYVEACHGVFLLIFLENSLEFPDDWYLQPFFFLVPIVGLGAVADSLIRLAFLTFSQKQNLQEWQRMVASLYKDHIVVVGVGKVGLQLVKELLSLGEAIVAVEIERNSPFVDEIHDLGVPLIAGDGRVQKTLEFAGVRKAKAVILATDDDLTNLDSALTAQNVNPRVRLVLRLYDETLGAKVRSAFNMPAISIAHVSAPSFIAAATGEKVYPSLRFGGREHQLVDLEVAEQGVLVGRSVREVQERWGLTVVRVRTAEGSEISADADRVFRVAEMALVVASPRALGALRKDYRASRPATVS